MAEQLTYEGVQVGALVPPLLKQPVTMCDLVMWAAASEDFTDFHFDEAAAKARGFPGPVTNGPYKAALIARMLTDWIGPEGVLVRLACQYRRLDVVGDNLACRGKVTDKRVKGGECLVDLEVWTENGRGEVTTTGTATVALPPAGKAAPPGQAAELPSLVNDEVRAALRLGELAGTFTYEVERGWLRRFAKAVGDDNPLWRDEEYAAREGRFGGVIAPPTFWAALDPVERRDLWLESYLDQLPYKRTGGGNAFNEVEYYLPIRPGDTITVSTRYTELYERDGRAGRLLFQVRENELTNQHGELVARTRGGHVMAFDLTRMQED